MDNNIKNVLLGSSIVLVSLVAQYLIFVIGGLLK